MEVKKKKIEEIKKIFDECIGVTLYYKDSGINLEHVENGISVHQVGGKDLGYFDSFDKMLDELFIDGATAREVLSIVEEIFY